MNTRMHIMMKVVVGMSLVMLVGMTAAVPPVRAGELPEHEWSLQLGTGALLTPVYPGSDALLINAVPYINTEYTTTYVDFLAGIEDGIGVRVKAPVSTDLSLSVAVNPFGVERDPKLNDVEDYIVSGDADNIKQFLNGTPTVKSPIELFGTVAWAVPFGTMSSTVTYLPITADYDQAGRADKDYNGLTVSLDVESGLPLTPQIFLQGSLGTTWMNSDYTEAFYGVAYPTPSLKVFKTEDGNDIHGSVALVSYFTEHIGAIVSGSATLLLGDVTDSPLIKETFQPDVAVLAFYNF